MNFEDLLVWKKALKLTIEVCILLKNIKDIAFRDQVTRSSLSIPSNIAEGFERTSQRECLSFLSYAKGSCAELRTQVYIGIAIGYIGQEVGKHLIQEAKEISAMLGALMKTKRGFLLKK